MFFLILASITFISAKSAFIISEKEFKDGYTKELSKGDSIRFNIGFQTHSVVLDSITDSSATINISSRVQQATLSTGEIKKFDLADDGYYDLSVKLDSISGDSATLGVKSIYEKIILEEEIVNKTVENETSEEETEESTDTITERITKLTKIEKSYLWLWFILVFIVVVSISVIYIILARLRYKYKSKKSIEKKKENNQQIEKSL